jgi:hypothetical protein
MIEWFEKIFEKQHSHERKLDEIMANQKDLAAAITALPALITTAVLVPIQAEIATIEAGASGNADTQPSIDALNGVPALVSAQVAAAIASSAAPPVVPVPTVVTNSDGSVTTTTFNADGSVATVQTKDTAGNIIPNP